MYVTGARAVVEPRALGLISKGGAPFVTREFAYNPHTFPSRIRERVEGRLCVPTICVTCRDLGSNSTLILTNYHVSTAAVSDSEIVRNLTVSQRYRRLGKAQKIYYTYGFTAVRVSLQFMLRKKTEILFLSIPMTTVAVEAGVECVLDAGGFAAGPASFRTPRVLSRSSVPGHKDYILYLLSGANTYAVVLYTRRRAGLTASGGGNPMDTGTEKG